ncbi:hypothetical protein BV25DRAFT_1178437 [Artomyces pyxidatus]|uniref:Uncharacterized protein n=1 Tax=Artomyces pyxidatus TaxID=48021 RepID=A0ACB8SSA1_9AGAM|nr:hypothetical protein BV25DRAFT_1178437 [Artomyces pyxidatus]
MGISQVCGHWREITLDLKNFWSFLPLELNRPPCKWLELSIARSNPAPVYIHAELQYFDNKSRFGSTLLLALGEISRAREIHIYYPRHEVFSVWPDVARSLCSTTAPVLEVLDIEMTHLHLDGDMFGGNVPRRLHTLYLTRVQPISLKSSLFHALLTALQLVNIRLVHSYGQMVEVLARLPNLHTLILDGIVVSRRPLSFKRDYFRDVALPALRRLEIVENIGHIVKLMQQLLLPPTPQSPFAPATMSTRISTAIPSLPSSRSSPPSFATHQAPFTAGSP